MAVKTWTAEENERLKALVAKDASIVKVAAELGRTTRSLRVQARKLGTPFPRMKDYRKNFRPAQLARGGSIKFLQPRRRFHTSCLPWYRRARAFCSLL